MCGGQPIYLGVFDPWPYFFGGGMVWRLHKLRFWWHKMITWFWINSSDFCCSKRFATGKNKVLVLKNWPTCRGTCHILDIFNTIGTGKTVEEKSRQVKAWTEEWANLTAWNWPCASNELHNLWSGNDLRWNYGSYGKNYTIRYSTNGVVPLMPHVFWIFHRSLSTWNSSGSNCLALFLEGEDRFLAI